MNFKELICPNCQGSNFTIIGDICSCKYCLSKFTKKQIDSKMFVDLRQANNERNSANFDKAKKIYKTIINDYPNEDLSDAYWGQFLCEQRVLFEEDGKGEKFPSFYRMNLDEESIVDDSPSFAKALSYALKNNRDRLEVFNTLADKIDNARKMYFDIQSKTKPFDIFICFKNTDEKGNHTPDRELAMDIYNEFSGKYNIFFSEKTLKNIKSNYREYEPNIYYGLYTAKIMLLICSKKEYLESQWLKNEWSRFTQINRQGGENKCIIPIFTDNFNPNDLPDELWHNQGIFDDRKLMTTLENTLENILHPVDKLEELRKQQEEELKKQREELAKQQEKYALFENFIREQQKKEEEQRKLENERKKELENQKTKEEELKKQKEELEKQILEQEKQKLDNERKKLDEERKRLEQERKNEQEKQSNLINQLENRLNQPSSIKQTITDINAPQLSLDGKTITFGYYDGIPVEWRILEKKNNTYKLIADKILDKKPYNKDVFAKLNNFNESDMYKWLNTEFFNSIFTEKQKPYVLTTKYSFTEGKVLLLDKDTCEGIDFVDRIRRYNNFKRFPTNYTNWWIVSSNNERIIINEKGYKVEKVSPKDECGVVPVITVTLDLTKKEIEEYNTNLKNEIKNKINKELLPKLNPDSTITFGNYKQSGNNPEPIIWKILSYNGDNVIAIADKILSYDGYSFIRSSFNNFENSSLKEKLQTTMKKEMFSDEQLMCVKNLSIPSLSDVENLIPENRIKKATNYAKKLGLSVDNQDNAPWLLSSSVKGNLKNIYGVDSNGNINSEYVFNGRYGIVPIITIDFNPYKMEEFAFEPQYNKIKKEEEEKELQKQKELETLRKKEELDRKKAELERKRKEKEELERKKKEKEEFLKKKDLIKEYMPIFNQGNTHVTFGNYIQNSNTPEPITWRVLEIKGKKAYLIADKILDCATFCKEDVKNNNFYENSDIRKWLNNDFYNTAFNKFEQYFILEEDYVIHKPDKSTYTVKDKVCLPSEKEQKSYAYNTIKLNSFHSEEFSKRLPTPYSLKKGCKIPYENSTCGDFWYRTRTGFLNKGDKVDTSAYLSDATNSNIGVVPVITIDLNLCELNPNNTISKTSAPIFNIDNTRAAFGKYVQYLDNKLYEIRWRVLEIKNNIATLYAAYVLDSQVFDNITSDYGKSSIRKWLNNDFFNKAFTDEEKKYIVKTEHEFGTDNVFLLSKEELKKVEAFDRKAIPSLYIAKKVTVKDGRASWWTRTTNNSNQIVCVNHKGEFDNSIKINENSIGIVPAINIKLN